MQCICLQSESSYHPYFKSLDRKGVILGNGYILIFPEILQIGNQHNFSSKRPKVTREVSKNIPLIRNSFIFNQKLHSIFSSWDKAVWSLYLTCNFSWFSVIFWKTLSYLTFRQIGPKIRLNILKTSPWQDTAFYFFSFSIEPLVVKLYLLEVTIYFPVHFYIPTGTNFCWVGVTT